MPHCSDCGSSFANASTLRRHQRRCPGNDNFPAKQEVTNQSLKSASLTFKLKGAASENIEPQVVSIENVSDSANKTDSGTRASLRRTNVVRCTECGKHFYSGSILEAHMKSAHPGMLNKEDSGQVGSDSGAVCGNSYSGTGNEVNVEIIVQKSQESEDGEDSRSESLKPSHRKGGVLTSKTGSPPKKVDCCEECDKVFSSFLTLQRHKQNAHGSSLPSSHYFIKCDLCGECFKKPQHLDMHMRASHEDEVLADKMQQQTNLQLSTLEVVTEPVLIQTQPQTEEIYTVVEFMKAETSIPGASIIPGIPGSSMIPGIPGSSIIPGIPGRSMIPGIPGVSIIPGTPGTSMIPGIPESSIIPASSDMVFHSTGESDVIENTSTGLHTSVECQVCTKQFPSPELLALHRKRDHSFHQHPFRCCRCDKLFISLEILRKHYRTHITGKKAYKCTRCPGNKYLPTCKKYLEHIRGHFSEKRPKCDVCGRQFWNQNVFEFHKKMHDKNESVHVCEYCDVRFVTECQLQSHHLSHIAYVTLHCEVCSRDYKTREGLRRHQKKHYADMLKVNRKYMCRVCKKPCKEVSLLIKHQREHIGLGLTTEELSKRMQTTRPVLDQVTALSAYKCQLCLTEAFATEEDLTEHVNSVVAVTALSEFKCQLCLMEAFATEEDLTEHVNSVHLADMDLHNVKMEYDENGQVVLQFNLSDIPTKARAVLATSKPAPQPTKQPTPQQAQQPVKRRPIVNRLYKCLFCNDGVEYQRHEYNAHLTRRHNTKECPKCAKTFDSVAKCRKHFHTVHGEKVYQCEQCPRAYVTPSDLSYHVKMSHSDLRPHICESCGKGFKARHKLENHVNTVHSTGVQLECPECGTTFKTSSGLKLHMARHELRGNQPHQRRRREEVYTTCERCGQQFNTVSELMDHERAFHGEQIIYRCEVCGKSLTSARAVKKHTRSVHQQGDPSIKCDYCGACFKTKFNLKRHQVLHMAGDKVFKCHLCPKRFNRAQALDLHIRRHTGFKSCECELCKALFTTAKELRNHEEKEHVNSDGTYNCPYCHMIFQDYRTLLLHKRIHTNPPLPPSDKPKRTQCNLCGDMIHPHSLKRHQEVLHGSSDTNTIWACNICPEKFTSNLKRHQEVLHGSSDTNTIWACNICPEKFTSKYSLRVHAKKHDPVTKRFGCNICNKVFKVKKSLNLHMVLHYYVFMCKVCGKTFNKRTSFSIHMRKHTHPKKKLTCELCGQVFTQRKIWYEHQKTHLGEKYECKYCSKFYSKVTTLDLHIKTVHRGEDKLFKCEKCGKGFDLKGSLTRHLQNHGKLEYECSQCGMAFAKYKSMKSHMKVHGVPRIECGKCDLLFTSEKHLENHKLTFHADIAKVFAHKDETTSVYVGGEHGAIHLQDLQAQQGMEITYPTVAFEDPQYINVVEETQDANLEEYKLEDTARNTIEVQQEDGSIVYFDQDYIITDDQAETEAAVHSALVASEDNALGGEEVDAPVVIQGIEPEENALLDPGNYVKPPKQIYIDQDSAIEYEYYEYEVVDEGNQAAQTVAESSP